MELKVEIGSVVPEGRAMTRWVVVAELVDLEDGGKELFFESEEGMETYEIEGFLRRAIRLVLDDEDSEDIE